MLRRLAACTFALALGALGAFACEHDSPPPEDECDPMAEQDPCPGPGSCILCKTHLACCLRCNDDADCPEGQACESSGASCLTCHDIIDICVSKD